MNQMRRNNKNIRRKKPSRERQLKYYEFPWDGETYLKILATSREAAEKVALNLCKNVAARFVANLAAEKGNGEG